MDVYFEGILKIFIKKAFENKEGEHIEYNEAYFLTTNKDGEDSVIKINTKTDLSKHLDLAGVGQMQLLDSGKRRLVSFVPQRSKTTG